MATHLPLLMPQNTEMYFQNAQKKYLQELSDITIMHIKDEKVDMFNIAAKYINDAGRFI